MLSEHLAEYRCLLNKHNGIKKAERKKLQELHKVVNLQQRLREALWKTTILNLIH